MNSAKLKRLFTVVEHDAHNPIVTVDSNRKRGSFKGCFTIERRFIKFVK